MKLRRCARCSRPLSRRARADAKYCSDTCRAVLWHRRARTSRALANRPKCKTCRKRIVIAARADTVYCSPRCRQRAYRGRKAATAKPKAHQRSIRDRLAAEDTAPSRAVDIGTATVRPITTAEAKDLIERYEWLGNLPAVSRHCFGIFFGERCGGAAIFGDEYGENLGVRDRYGFDGKIIALLRGACTHWAHPHSASKLIRRAMDLLPAHYKIVTGNGRWERRRDWHHLSSLRLRLCRHHASGRALADADQRQDHVGASDAPARRDTWRSRPGAARL